MSNTTLPDQHAVITQTDGQGTDDLSPCGCGYEWDDEHQRWDIVPPCEACSARAADFERLVAECEPAVSLHGERLNQLPPLTLADELAEVDQAVADGMCSPEWADDARQLIAQGHGLEPWPDDDEDDDDAVADASTPNDAGRATDTSGCDPPVSDNRAVLDDGFDRLTDFERIPGVADSVAYLLDAQRRRGTPLSKMVAPGVIQVECPARCCWYVFHGASGACLSTGRSRDGHHRAVVHGPAGSATQRVRMEQPGPHAFPAISSTTTAGARLVLAMMGRATTDLDGCWAHCDTDSAKIVATPAGGLVPCPGGPHRIAVEPVEAGTDSITPSAPTEAVQALSWGQVADIAARFDSLRPKGSRRPLWTVEHYSLTWPLTALVTGPKSYALYRPSHEGIDLVAWTETSLGESYLPPEPGWSCDAWRWIIARALGQVAEPPAWWGGLALCREAAVNPIMARAAEASGVAARPFGFRLAATAWGGGDTSPVAPYSRDSATWPALDWRDRHTGKALRVTPETEDEEALPGGLPGERTYIATGTLGQVVRRVAGQAVPTFVDPLTGEPATHRARGLLWRRSTVADRLELVGADRTPLAHKGELADQRYPTCEGCGAPLDGRADQQRCIKCKKRAERQRAKDRAAAPKRIAIRPPRVCPAAGCPNAHPVLTGRQREWCSKRCARAGERERAWLERLERMGGRPCSADESCRTELFGGAVCTFHERRAS